MWFADWLQAGATQLFLMCLAALAMTNGNEKGLARRPHGEFCIMPDHARYSLSCIARRSRHSDTSRVREGFDQRIAALPACARHVSCAGLYVTSAASCAMTNISHD